MWRSLVALILFLFTSCEMTPLTPFPSSHPASTAAQEAAFVPFQNNLTTPDPAIQRTQYLLLSQEKK